MLLFLLACTDHLVEPDLTGCTVVQAHDDFPADGTPDRVFTRLEPEEGHVLIEGYGPYWTFSSETMEDPKTGCLLQNDFTYTLTSGLSEGQALSTTCDDHGNILTYSHDSWMANGQTTRWSLEVEHTLDDDGLSLHERREYRVVGAGTVVNLIEHTYDAEGLETERRSYFGEDLEEPSLVETFAWDVFEGPAEPALVAHHSFEQGVLVASTDSTYDDVGRVLVQEIYDGESTETVTTTWEPERWRMVEQTRQVRSGLTSQHRVVHEEDDEGWTRTLLADEQGDVVDGSVDRVEIQEVICD